MKKHFFYTMYLLLSCIVFITLSAPAGRSVSAAKAPLFTALPIPSVKPDNTVDLTKQVEQWITLLSREKGFEEWKGAQWEITPLGPGTHSWVVLLRNSEKEVGYLLIGEAKDGSYELTEYGTSTKPLYSLKTLYQSMIRQEIIAPTTTFLEFNENPLLQKERMHLGTLQTFWKVTLMHDSFYFDAKSGERLLHLEQQLAQANPTAGAYETALKLNDINERIELEAFDPMDKLSWIGKTPLPIESFSQLKAILQGDQQITFTASLYDKKAIYPFAVVGYHGWNNGVGFIKLDHDGPRYVLFDALLSSGLYYQ